MNPAESQPVSLALALALAPREARLAARSLSLDGELRRRVRRWRAPPRHTALHLTCHKPSAHQAELSESLSLLSSSGQVKSASGASSGATSVTAEAPRHTSTTA